MSSSLHAKRSHPDTNTRLGLSSQFSASSLKTQGTSVPRLVKLYKAVLSLWYAYLHSPHAFSDYLAEQCGNLPQAWDQHWAHEFRLLFEHYFGMNVFGTAMTVEVFLLLLKHSIAGPHIVNIGSVGGSCATMIKFRGSVNNLVVHCVSLLMSKTRAWQHKPFCSFTKQATEQHCSFLCPCQSGRAHCRSLPWQQRDMHEYLQQWVL